MVVTIYACQVKNNQAQNFLDQFLTSLFLIGLGIKEIEKMLGATAMALSIIKHVSF